MIETPAFMPVGTLGTVRTLEPQEVLSMGYQLILGNTYHLSLRPGIDVIRSFGGLKPFMNWPGAILTDSGGFQIFSLSKIRRLDDDGVSFSAPEDGGAIHRLTPEGALEIQHVLGSDIAMVLDDCPPHPCEPDRLVKAVERTIAWAKRSADWLTRPMSETSAPGASETLTRPMSETSALGASETLTRPMSETSALGASETLTRGEFNGSVFAITQGGTDLDLRKKCLDALLKHDFAGIAVGGLAVGEPNEVMYETLDRTLHEYPADRPRYLMGVGAPADLETCANLGIDLFDCVLPTRNARRGQILTSQGPVNIRNSAYEFSKDPPDPECACRVCQIHSRAYLRHLFMCDEILGLKLATFHNLFFIQGIMERIRRKIEAAG